jgi:hypothetical protein
MLFQGIAISVFLLPDQPTNAETPVWLAATHPVPL